MNPLRYDYAVIGGDLRQFYLTLELLKKNPSVCASALCQRPSDSAVCLVTVEEAVTCSAAIICPIPLSRDRHTINQADPDEPISLTHILSLLKKGQHFFAGCIPDEFFKKAFEQGVFVSDLMQDELLSHYNTIATAEGVLCEAIRQSPVNLHRSRCAVLGYGKCGRTLTDKLAGLSCHISVFTAPKQERAQAMLRADRALPLAALPEKIEQFDFIFNTIPSVVLTAEILKKTAPHAVILDIASAPGGIDFDAAKDLSVHAASCPLLPGRYAPLSSAKAIAASIQRILKGDPPCH